MAPGATHPLRRAVLRDGRPDLPVVLEGDEEREAVHLAAVDDDGTIVGVASFLDRECPARPGVHPARQLRGMAVAPERRGEGLGARLLVAGVERCRRDGARVVWANARTSAVSWYEANGFTAEQDEYVYGVMGLPHRTVVADL